MSCAEFSGCEFSAGEARELGEARRLASSRHATIKLGALKLDIGLSHPPGLFKLFADRVERKKKSKKRR